ncbi:MAG: sigma 54-interacting transcriptional regulator [Polyangiaceae bacterium]|nr:sigma 54-interacting transcriptional regulator [Polyangiaceae bacterium]
MVRLEVTFGRASGATFELAKPFVTVGRSDANDIVLDDEHVSARHARIVLGLDAPRVEDLGSTNGTFVRRGDDREAVTERGASLGPADVVELGSGAGRAAFALRFDEGAAHLVSVKPLGEAAQTEARLAADPDVLRKLYAAQTRIGRASGLGAVLDAVADAVFELVHACTHVTVVLREQDGPDGAGAGNYLPVLTRARRAAPGGGERFVPVTRSVYRRVLEDRAAVLAAEAATEIGRSASIMRASVRSTIAVPLCRGDDILGVLQVDNRDAPGMLQAPDLELLLVLGEHATLAIAGARVIARLAAAEERLENENRFLRGREARRRAAPSMVGDNEAMRALAALIDKVADTRVTVLIEGETGTGKELVAAAIHERSRRRDRLFVALNCAALAEGLLESELFGHRKGAFTGASEDKKGLFELADGSTLFLDEVTEAPIAIQSKLLRALQEGEIRAVGASEARHVNVRVVAATNRDLEAEVRAGRFREDLYYRLTVFPIRVPPLRERRSDIPLLVAHFLARHARELGKTIAGVAPEAMALLVGYDWPGNVRELENEVQRLAIQAEPGAFASAELLSSRLRRGERTVREAGAPKGTLRDMMAEVERYLLGRALREHGDNKTAAAKALGITREGLHKKLRQMDGKE